MEALASEIAIESDKIPLSLWRYDWSPPGEELSRLATAFRAKQVELAKLLKESGNPWMVTDFVTLGSPLTHADVLLAEDLNDLKRRQGNRELPVCPPFLEIPTGENHGRFSYNPPARDKDPQPSERRLLHFAAPFSVVRWTNLYFPASFIVRGDVIGGPVAGPFGYGIRDVELPAEPGVAFLSHTKYWTQPAGGKQAHIDALKAALNLANRP